MRRKVTGWVLALAVGFPIVCVARCKPAQADQAPHGANEFVLLAEQTVGHLRGVVRYPMGEPVKDSVVEIYSYETGTTDYRDIDKVLRDGPRLQACIPSDNGSFSFGGLKPGRYLLRGRLAHLFVGLEVGFC